MSSASDFAINLREADLRSLLSHTSDLVLRIDPAGRHLYVNPVVEATTGLPADTFLGRSLRDMGFAEPTCRAWEDAITESVERGAPCVFECDFPTNRGMRRLRSWLIPERSVDGQVVALLAIGRVPSAPRDAAGDEVQAWLSTLVGTSGEAMMSFDLDGTISTWNAAAHRLFGYSAAEAIGRSVSLLVPMERVDEPTRVIERVRSGETLVSLDTVRVRKDGSRIDVSITVTPVRNAAGRVIAGAAVVRDVGERQRAVRALRASEARFRAALQATSDILWTNNAAGEMTGPQPQWSAFTGQTQAEYEGYGWSSAVHPDDAQPTIDAWNRAVDARTMFEFEHRVRRFDGVYRTFAIRAVPVVDDHDEITEWVGVHTDVTEQRRAEAALAASEHQLAAIANNATLALFVLDERQQCVYMNPSAERLTGYSLSEVAGRPLHDVIHHSRPDGRPYPAAECPIEQAFPQNRQHQGSEIFIHKNGTFYPVAFTASPIRDSGIRGTAVGTIIEARDITYEQEAESERMRLLERERRARAEAEEARAEAERANQAKSEFLAVMSHELRTPLNAIGGHAQILELGIHGPLNDAQRDAILRIDRSQKHLLRLINDVLNLARVESGRVAYELREVPLREAVDDLWPMIGPQLAAKTITYDVSIPDDAIVRADREKLQQILLNLIGNAIKFTPEYGHIWIDVAAHKRSTGIIFVRITDNGPGIPPDKIESIFEPFVQVDVSHTRRSEGAGLGLTISRDLARGMGGDLRARSTQGVGSTFTLTLRRARPVASPTE